MGLNSLLKTKVLTLSEQGEPNQNHPCLGYIQSVKIHCAALEDALENNFKTTMGSKTERAYQSPLCWMIYTVSHLVFRILVITFKFYMVWNQVTCLLLYEIAWPLTPRKGLSPVPLASQVGLKLVLREPSLWYFPPPPPKTFGTPSRGKPALFAC